MYTNKQSLKILRERNSSKHKQLVEAIEQKLSTCQQ